MYNIVHLRTQMVQHTCKTLRDAQRYIAKLESGKRGTWAFEFRKAD